MRMYEIKTTITITQEVSFTVEAENDDEAGAQAADILDGADGTEDLSHLPDFFADVQSWDGFTIDSVEAVTDEVAA